MNDKPKYVTFRDKKLESTCEDLKTGKFQDKKLYEFIERATKDIKKDVATTSANQDDCVAVAVVFSGVQSLREPAETAGVGATGGAILSCI